MANFPSGEQRRNVAADSCRSVCVCECESDVNPCRGALVESLLDFLCWKTNSLELRRRRRGVTGGAVMRVSVLVSRTDDHLSAARQPLPHPAALCYPPSPPSNISRLARI